MKTIIKFELRRAFINRAYLLALAIGIGICIWHLAALPGVYSAHFQSAGAEFAGMRYPPSLYNSWLGSAAAQTQLNLYFFILPLLVCIPFVGSYHSDRAHGYAVNVITRVKASHYYCAKLLAIFLTAVSIAIIPLIFDMFATALFVPALLPKVTAATFTITPYCMWAEIFYQTPLLYFAMYFVLIIAPTSGLLALLGAAISYYAGHSVFCLLAPFAVCAFSAYFLAVSGPVVYAPSSFMQPAQMIPTDGFAVLATLGILVIGLGLLFFFKIRKDELI